MNGFEKNNRPLTLEQRLEIKVRAFFGFSQRVACLSGAIHHGHFPAIA